MAVIGNTVGFWLVYAAAWLPYAVTYSAIALALSPQPAWRVLASTVAVVTIAAVLGLAVLAVPERLSWPPRRPWRFAATHAAAAPAYSIVWTAGVFVVFSVDLSLVNGHWTPAPLASGWVPWQILTGLLVYGTVASIAYGLHVTSRLHEQRIRAERAEALRVEAELRALRSSLDPHFLFNTLHTLMALVRHDPAAAEVALERFADTLRYVLKAGDRNRDVADDVSLGEEWRFVQSYLELEQLRLGDRLRVEADIAPDALACPVPVFALQPLVENAIKHSIALRAAGGTIRISARLETGDLVISVSDDGPGADRTALDATKGLGLHAVRQRLDLRYAGRARFDIETSPGRGFSSEVRIPIGEGE